MSSIHAQNTQLLAARCQEAMTHFQPVSRAEDACFELFARALLQQDAAAWDALVAQYRRLILFWIGAERSDAEDLMQELLWHFWARYKGVDLAAHFDDLPHLLRYLQRAAHNAVISAERRTAHEVLVAEVDSAAQVGAPETDALRHLAADHLLELIAACAQTPDEQLVMALSYEVGLAPRQICQAHPQRFGAPRTVSLIKERVLTRIRHALAAADVDRHDLQ